MEIRRTDLERAADAGIITHEQAEALWGSLSPPPAAPRAWSREDSILLGATGLITALSAWALVAAWERFGGAGAVLVSVPWGLFLLRASRWAAGRGLEGAAGILLGLSVVALPIAVNGSQHWLGLDGAADVPVTDLASWAMSHGFLPAVAGVVAAVAAIRLRPAPFLSSVLVAALWFLLMDGAPVLFGPALAWSDRAALSALLGVLVLGAGLGADGGRHRDHAFWLYLAGLVAFWGGITTYHFTSGLSLAFGGFVNAGLLFLALALRRRVFAVFGGLGLAGVLGQAAEALVDPLVPFVLAAIVLAIAAGTASYSRIEPPMARAVRRRLPPFARRFLPPLEA